MKKILLLALSSLLLVGCSTPKRTEGQHAVKYGDSPLISNLSEKDIVSAELFKHVFNRNPSAFQKNVSSFCIGTTNEKLVEDPQPSLLSLFSNYKPNVLPASMCISKNGGIVDNSGKRVISFYISNLKKIQMVHMKHTLDIMKVI